MKSKETLTINALELDLPTLYKLAAARQLGLTISNSVIDSLADGGAATILSFGKKQVKELFPNGLSFELTYKDKRYMDLMLNDSRIEPRVRAIKETFNQVLT